jgi:hypothetical protein
MENLRRLGGEAGVLAGVAMAWMFLGLVVLFPASGLNFDAHANPHRYLPFVAKQESLVWSVNILGGVLAALMGTVLFMALGDRFKEGETDGGARIASTAGVVGAAGLAAAEMIRQFGIVPLAVLYKTNQVGAVHAFRAMSGVAGGLAALSGLFIGVAALVFAVAMRQEKNYQGAGVVGLITGGAMVLSAFISHTALAVISMIGAAAWFGWSAWVMRTESGPAFIRWGTGSRDARSRQRAA